ncbi:hypothetical protein P775_04855 [Puniceibacterium antarcticum]|uniref:Uncharacterized protein n=1 Tax=Puniceibacterium antarcticum TaxID=1206336 RepID=A0A2G8RIU5_9RHOB|nr:hypothetical protein [Puniceibacterium antarcticum]PIL21321.1 hypothetical protein P775_04855 [Puniceibacterium antarcticum]
MINEAASSALHGLNVLLFFCIGRHELHIWQHQGGADGISIILIVLLMLDEGFDLLHAISFTE